MDEVKAVVGKDAVLLRAVLAILAGVYFAGGCAAWVRQRWRWLFQGAGPAL
ncbi:MAG: hypothetical protein ACLR7U_02615 [Ruthenibacterium lactatiformans]